VQFHSAYEEARYWLPHLEDRPDRGFSYSVLSVLRPALDAVEGVQEALAQIEDLATISPRADLPDVKDARDAVELEEEWWEDARHDADEQKQ
jgi:hypothetical protein